MKKNKMMRLASGMMVMTLLTTSVISGTFAKYVTSDSADDSARVAKWGVTVLASGSLFGGNYYPNSTSETSDKISAEAKQSVDVDGEGNIVAPGTQSAEGLVLAIAGKPEVAYKVEMESVTEDNSDIWLAAGEYGVMVDASVYVDEDNFTKYYVNKGTSYEFATGTYDDDETYYELHDQVKIDAKYYPIEWTVTKNGNIAGATKTRLVADVVTALEAIEGVAGLPNVDVNDTYVVTWKWAFTKDAQNPDQNDGADTILGNLQAAKAGDNYEVVKKNADTYVDIEDTDYSLKVGFNVKVTATQID